MPPALSDYDSSEDDFPSPTTPTTSASPNVVKDKSWNDLGSEQLVDTVELSTQLQNRRAPSKDLTQRSSARKKRLASEAELREGDSVGDREGSTESTGRKRVRRKSPTVPGTKKRSGLLSGLDIDNVIELSDEIPTSSNPTSSYRTRAQVRGRPKHDLCYNMRYHPMDEVTFPKRAAKVKAEYDIEDTDSEISLHGGSGSEVDSDVENLSSDDVEEVCYPSPVRRSLRPMTGTPLMYDMSVHPQDSVIAELEQASSPPPGVQIDDSDVESLNDGTVIDDQEDDITLNSYAPLFSFDDEAHKDDDSQNDSSEETDKENQDPSNTGPSSSPIGNSANVPSSRRNRTPNRRAREETPFEIYVETPVEQAANIAFAPIQIDYHDYDQENVHAGPDPNAPEHNRSDWDSVLGEMSPNRFY